MHGEGFQFARHVLPAASEWCVYVAALAATGGMAFLAFIHDRRRVEQARLARLVIVAATIAAAATVLAVPLQAYRITASPQALPDVELLAAVLESGYGMSALVRLAGLFVLLLAAARLWAGQPAVAAGVGGALVAAWSFVLMGHSISAEPRAVVVAATGAHLLASAVWFGGLVLLWRVLALRGQGGLASADGVGRFSRWAGVAVVVLVASGVALAWAHGRSLSELAATGYGWTLAGKTLVVAAVLMTGAYNRQRLVPAVGEGDVGASDLLRRTVAVEACVIGVVVVGVTAALINLPPPALEVDPLTTVPASDEVGVFA